MLDRVMEEEFRKTIDIFDEFVKKSKNDPLLLQAQR